MRRLLLLLPLAAVVLSGCVPVALAPPGSTVSPQLVRYGTPLSALLEQTLDRPTDVQTCDGTRYDRVDLAAQGGDSLLLWGNGLPLATLSLAHDVRRVTVRPRPSRVPYYVAGGMVVLGLAAALAPISCPKDDEFEAFGCGLAVTAFKAGILPASLLGGAAYGALTAGVLRLRPTVEHRYGCPRPVE